MKKSIIGIFSITALLFLTGCYEDNPFPNQPKSVVQMMKEKKVVGWIDYKKDSDKDGVADYKDKCSNTLLGVKVDKNGCAVDSDKDGVNDYFDKCPNTKIGIKVDKSGCPIDSDNDGIPDYKDKCPNTPKNLKVDKYGCVLDMDEDGVPDYKDKCPNTIRGSRVDQFGCSIDSDGDGIVDGVDICPNTPKGAKVNSNGCAIDSDADGIIDLFDKCPNTKIGIKVDKRGCPIDSDNDGIPNYKDKCPNTPKGVKVNFEGCPVLHIFRFNFKLNSAHIDSKYYPEIEKLAKILKNNRKLNIKIEGFTDSTGTKAYNKTLSLKRANALRKILVYKYRINPRRIRIYGFGDSHSIAPNNTKEGRRLNRRIVVVSR
jgi:hypothetical protein